MRYIDEVNFESKRIIVRCDFNVPIEDGEITDNTRIVKSLKTINYLLSKNCSLVLMSHLGRVKSRDDKITNTLKPVSEALGELLGREVKFCPDCVGMDVLKTCKCLKPGEIVLLENTRFCDFPEKLESGNDANLAKYWSSLGDAFVVDAFGSLHRAHASVAGIAKYIPSYLGLLVKDELEGLDPVISNIKRPFTVFMGGAKIDDKLPYIKGILPKCDYLLIGGGIANSFLRALGYDVKDSICTKDEIILDDLKNLYKQYKDKIITPLDFVFDNNMILDLGTKSINKYVKYLSQSKTIFINGTCGKFEDDKFATGTKDLFNALKEINAIKIAGGGDTINAIHKFKLAKNFTFLSSGGGASLEYLSFHRLEGLEYIEKK